MLHPKVVFWLVVCVSGNFTDVGSPSATCNSAKIMFSRDCRELTGNKPKSVHDHT